MKCRAERTFGVLRARLALLALAAALAGPAAAGPLEELFQAIKLDDATAVRTHLLRGADANARDASGTPAIVAAARDRAFEVTRALAMLRATNLNATNRQGESALMLAALHGDMPTVRLLIERGAEVNKPGWAPLHYAATGGHLEIVELLLERSAFIDATSPNGTTPLMMAVRQRHPTIARRLVEAGADPTLVNESGWTAAEYARRLGDAELGAWLQQQADIYKRKYYNFAR